MPELPEVQAVVDSLQPLVGSQITAVAIHRNDIRRQVESYITTALPGRSVAAVTRRAKLIVFHLDNSSYMTVHLGMTGQLLLNPPAIPHTHPHTHVTFNLSNFTLAFVDPRRFGRVRLASNNPHDDPLIAPEPLDISPADFTQRLRSCARPLKPALLDQRRIVCGLGNIYADEALHLAGLHPKTRCSRVPATRATRLHACIQTILRAAISAGGSTLRDYVNARGERGEYALSHKVYGRGGELCLTCNSAVVKSFMYQQRTTAFCPVCQPRKITG